MFGYFYKVIPLNYAVFCFTNNDLKAASLSASLVHHLSAGGNDNDTQNLEITVIDPLEP